MAEYDADLEQHRLAEGPITYETGYDTVDRFVANAIPDAIYCASYCASDVIAFGVLDRLREFKIRVPDDTSVIAVDGLPMSGRRASGLTTRAQDIETVVRTSIEILATRMAGADAEARRVFAARRTNARR